MHIETFIVLFLVGIVSGFIGSTAGGSGLINTPLLLAFGLNPYVALATSKFIAMSGMILGSLKYYKAKIFTHTYFLLLLIVISSVGGIIAANLTLTINAQLLKYLIIIVCLFVLVMTFIKKTPKNIKSDEKMTVGNNILNIFVLFLVSIYTGSIGVGAGIFLIYTFVYFMKYSYLKSSAMMNVIAGTVTLISTIVFALKGYVNYEYGLPLFIGTGIGGWAGARIAIKKGDTFIKILSAVIAGALLIKVLTS